MNMAGADLCAILLHRMLNQRCIFISLLTTNRWFMVTAGTGIVSVLLYDLPYNATWLYWISIVIFVFNFVIFIIATLMSMARYILWPQLWSDMIHDPNEALFIGAAPMVYKS